MKKTTLILAGIALIASAAMFSMVSASGVQVNLTPSIVDDGTVVTIAPSNQFIVSTNSVNRWDVDVNGNLNPVADSAYSIGSTTMRPANIRVDNLNANSLGISAVGAVPDTFINRDGSGNMFFQTSSTDRWSIGDSSGHLLPAVDSTYRIGSSSLAVDVMFVDDVLISSGGALGSGLSPVPTIHVTNIQARAVQHIDAATVLGAAATTFARSRGYHRITGDAGTNTLATITGGVLGQTLFLEFVDGLVTITDDNTHAANSIDLSAAFTSADDTILMLLFDGTSWYEVSRSVN